MKTQTLAQGQVTRQIAIATFCLLGLAILTATGCYLPPFNEKLSESEQFAAKLTHLGRLGPVDIDDWMYEGGYFLPSREFDAVTSPDGFWVRQSGTDLIASYMTNTGIHQSSHTTDNELAAGFVAFPLTTTQIQDLSQSSPKRGLFTIFGSSPSSTMPALGTDTGFGLSNSLFPICLTPPASIVGASYCVRDSAWDIVSVLYQSSAEPPEFFGGWAPVTSTAALSAGNVILPVISDSSGLVPPLLPGAFFGRCFSNSRFYVSGYRKADSTIYNAYWPTSLTSAPVSLPATAARISGILSTDRLLAVGDGIMYLYDLDGALVTSFTTGNMRFAYEYCGSDGVGYCYFTRNVRVKDNNSSGTFTVDVYRCRSDALDYFGG